MSRPFRDVVHLDATAIKETELALLCEIDSREVWIPKSQIHKNSDVQSEDDHGDLVISKWFAEKERLA
jgi:hypothetical protein